MSGTEQVTEYMKTLEHPLKKEIKQFYKVNNNQKENDITLFYQNLFKTII